MVPCNLLGEDAPLAAAFTSKGLKFVSVLISIGVVAGLTTTLLVGLYVQSRLYLGIGRDGLLPSIFAKIWERFRGGFDENRSKTTFCASGLHPDETCSCESFLMTEDASTRGSISRIVMLAEALFEVPPSSGSQPGASSSDRPTRDDANKDGGRQ